VPSIESPIARKQQPLPVSRHADTISIDLRAATAIRLQRMAIIQHRTTLSRTLCRSVTLDEAVKIRDTFGLEDVVFTGLSSVRAGSSRLTLEEGLAIERTLPDRRFYIHIYQHLAPPFGHRFHVEDVKTIAAILHPRAS